MIEIMISILNLDIPFTKSENIAILKGKYKIPETLKEGKKQMQWR